MTTFLVLFIKMQIFLKDTEISSICNQVLTFQFFKVVFDMQLHKMHIYYL